MEAIPLGRAPDWRMVMNQNEPNQADEQFLVSITGIKIKMRGLTLVILALGIAAAMGAVVIVKMSLGLPYAPERPETSDSSSSMASHPRDAVASHSGRR